MVENPKERKKELLIQSLSTPVGSMVCVVSDEGICMLEYDRGGRSQKTLQKLAVNLNANIREAPHALIDALSDQLMAYFAKQRTVFDLPLVMVGTPFQKQVWNQLMDIPYGQTRTYAAQARFYGNMNAIRAIARANAQNHLAILVPCHRVVGSDGSLTGYGGGIDKKRFLLNLEHRVEGTLF